MTGAFYLELDGLLDRIEEALQRKQPFSWVRVGDGENILLAQNTIWPMEKVLSEKWVIKANKGQKGVTLPNYELRDAIAESARRADVVGILPMGDDTIKAPSYLKRELTDQVFAHHQIRPMSTCNACLNRDLATTERFWSMLRGYRILIVTQKADELKALLEAEPYLLHVGHTIAFSRYEQMEEALHEIAAMEADFDIALFSCGVNAVVLAQRTAELTGKVAIDFGKAINILMYGKPN